MKNNIYPLLLILLFGWNSSFAQKDDFPPLPSPPRLVNDFADLLSKEQNQALERKLRMYNDSTSNEFTLVIIPSIGAYDVAQYGAELGERWKVGKKGKNNGLLLLIALEQRRIHIATGYGLEGAITDATAKRIIERIITPSFRQNLYYQGINQAMDELMKYASGEYTADRNADEPSPGEALFGILVILFIVLAFILPLAKNRRDNNNHMGGKGRNVDMVTTMMLMGMLGGGGRSGGGGGSFGGGSSFGGFGGGSFGGGGASGSW